MSKTTTPLSALLLPLLGATMLCAVACDARGDDAIEDRIDRLVAAKIKPDGPGCAVLVVDDSRIVFKRGYGIADLDSGRQSRSRA